MRLPNERRKILRFYINFMNIFVIIPAYNEEDNIVQAIKDVGQYAGGGKIIVVDDGSEDRTKSLAKEAGVFVLRHFINRGQGAALKTGTDFALAKGADIIVHFDADGQHQAKDIVKMIEPIEKGEADIVLGSRFLTKEAKSKIPWMKRVIILPLARFFTYYTTGLRLTDVHNGWRALSKEGAEAIQLTQDRMAHNSEIYAEIKRLNLKHKEVAVDIAYKEYGQGFFDGLLIIKDLIKGRVLK